MTERARVVIGADGIHSLVAKAVRPRRYNEAPRLTPLYYAYWSGLPVDEFKTYERSEHGRGWAVSPTHDGLTCVVQGWPQEEFEANRRDVEGAFMRSFDLVPEFAERIHAATRETRFVGSGNLPGFFRQPYGPGWALVGDAGYHKHPITGLGITDAFRDAELLASALDDCFAGRRPYEDALAGYQRERDEQALPLYELTVRVREARAASARPAGADRRDAGQPGRDGRLRERHGGHASRSPSSSGPRTRGGSWSARRPSLRLGPLARASGKIHRDPLVPVAQDEHLVCRRAIEPVLRRCAHVGAAERACAVAQRALREDRDRALEVVVGDLGCGRRHVDTVAGAGRLARVEDRDPELRAPGQVTEWRAPGREIHSGDRWDSGAYQTGVAQGRPSPSAVARVM